MLTLSSGGLRLNDRPLEKDRLVSVLAELAERRVFTTGPLTLRIQSDARVLDRKDTLKTLGERQIQYEIAENSSAAQ